ncbi:antitoxin [Hankyongella ginsenosidimutans]|uniref:Antitoxin n=1 Tax=Hankyongella ginsenosidimutans TaxID=1763828 RepID=A0A4D7C0W3_9SPHN|nr:antitoxin [Hankyongella ginsenosidimutans]QCI78671.1 antitoxin [Hankyongella ginsenosidimutans]
MSRLTIDLTHEQHQQIKAIAAMQGKTIKEYTLAKLLPLTADEHQAFNALKSLLHQRIETAQTDGASSKSFDDIVAEAFAEDHGQA